MNVDELGFYVHFLPGLRAMPQAQREALVADLLRSRPELEDEFLAEREQVAARRAYFSVDNGYEASVGNLDLYELFSQRYRRLVREGGRIGVVLPRTAFQAKGSVPFRNWLFASCPPERVDFLKNRARWAFDITEQYSVSLLVARRAGAAESISVAGVADSASAFLAQGRRPPIKLARAALGPGLEVPLVPTQEYADLLASLPTSDRFPSGGGRWRCFPVQGDFNETTHKAFWAGATSGRPLWKGESFDQYLPTGTGERLCPPSEAALKKQAKPKPGAGSMLAASTSLEQRRAALLRTVRRARIAFRDVSRATDARTVRACLVPPDHFLTNKAPYLVFLDDDLNAEAACLGVLNSLSFDWQARRYVEISLNFFILELLAVPRLSDDDLTAVGRAAGRLSCTDARFTDFAEGLGVEVGPLPDDQRADLRADIDARVARSWGMGTDDLETLFADFALSAVPEDYRQLVRNRFAQLD